MRCSWIRRNRLYQEKIKKLIEKSNHELEQGNLEAAERTLNKVKLSQEIQAQYSLFSKKRFIAPCCILIVFFLLIVPSPAPRIHFNLEVDKVTLRLSADQDFSWEPSSDLLEIRELSIDGNFTVEASDLKLAETAERLLVDGKYLYLSQLIISKGSRVEIQRSKDGVSLSIHEGRARGRFQLKNSEVFLRCNGQRKSYTVDSSSPVSTSLSFSSINGNGHRLRLKFQTKQIWQLYEFQVTDMRFQKEEPPGSGYYTSSIRKGTVKLPETKREEILVKYDELHIGKSRSTRLYLDLPTGDTEGFKLLYQGRAASVKIAQGSFEQHLRPSSLIWVYHQKQFFFVWGALTFVYGLLSNVRTLFARR